MNSPSPSSRPPRVRPRQQLPPGAGTFGMYLFLAALTMLFGGSMVGYIVIRLGVFGAGAGPGAGGLDLPIAFWASTLIILASSVSLHRGLTAVRHEQQVRFRQAMIFTLLLALGFLFVQTPAMIALMIQHGQLVGRQGGTALYGLMFVLVLVHALHVIGGIIPLLVITYHAHAGRYDHEQHNAVRYMSMYWHFLDGVWLVMFAIFLLFD